MMEQKDQDRNRPVPGVHDGKNLEAEIKLSLDLSLYEQIKSSFPPAVEGVCQENFFFDNTDGSLLKSKWTLRVRLQGKDKGFITVKGPGEMISALHCRSEYEAPIPRQKAEQLLKGFSLGSEDYLPCKELIKRFGNMDVLPFLSFQNIRMTFPWKEWKFELDRTTINTRIFYELEVETDISKKDDLEKELKSLFQSRGWTYIPYRLSKFKRALEIYMENRKKK
jgi:uncharacterized protein YjbK